MRFHLPQHEVSTAFECGWAELKNGELLDTAEKNGFAVFITTDSNLKYQQNLKSRRVAIVVLSTTSWPRIKNALVEVVSAVDASVESSYIEAQIP